MMSVSDYQSIRFWYHTLYLSDSCINITRRNIKNTFVTRLKKNEQLLIKTRHLYLLEHLNTQQYANNRTIVKNTIRITELSKEILLWNCVQQLPICDKVGSRENIQKQWNHVITTKYCHVRIYLNSEPRDK